MTPAYPSLTPRFGLPLLFAGQAQKEFFVNEALCAADLLLSPTVEGRRASPPDVPVPGETWLIAAEPTGAWAGRAGQIAGQDAGGWRFIAPVAGLRLYDKAQGQYAVFRDGWRYAAAPAAPTGGQVIDREARDAIMQLVASLRIVGILPQV